MPTINIDRAEFFKRLGKEYAFAEFDELLFEYGLELDEDTTTDPAHPADEPHLLKIEVPANRFDLLCLEGIVRALKLYLNPELGSPHYNVVVPKEQITVNVLPETQQIRPFFAGAVLRGVKFDKISYASFIDLQDKLHGNLARKRTLVAVGTHDLDHFAKGDITYEALPPKDIKFAPLNKTEVYDGEGLMKLYKEDRHLSKYLHIIENSPVFPIIYSSKREVLSMPPIINSNQTKISLETTNVFIDVTATDETKLGYVLDVLVTMFSEYCTEPFTVEPVRVVYTSTGRVVQTPNLSPRPFLARNSYINSCTGLNLPREKTISLLRQMGLDASSPPAGQQPAFHYVNKTELVVEQDDQIHVMVPPTRPDILHECDIMEDAAVAYGFNNLKRTFPATSTVAKPFPLNKLGDTMRRLCSEAGWIEVLPLTLCSHDENFAFLNRKDPGTLAVVLENPKTVEYEVVRTSLLPGLLKTIRENRKHSLPLRIFEVSDVVVKDAREERQARNIRRVAGVFCGRKAGFEIVQGLLDRLMRGLGVGNLGAGTGKEESGYYIKASDDATYFPGRSAKIMYRSPLLSGSNQTTFISRSATLPSSTLTSQSEQNQNQIRDVEIGEIGILHPDVLKAYELDFPCSSMEFNLEVFL